MESTKEECLPSEQPVAVGPFHPLSRLARGGRSRSEACSGIFVGTSSCPRCGRESGARRRADRRCPRRTRSPRLRPLRGLATRRRNRARKNSLKRSDTRYSSPRRVLYRSLDARKSSLPCQDELQSVCSTAQALRMGRLDSMLYASYSSESNRSTRTVKRGLDGQKKDFQA